jgi:hypothetical protein
MRLKLNLVIILVLIPIVLLMRYAYYEADRAFTDPTVVGAPQQSVLLTEAVFYALVALVILVAGTFVHIETQWETKKKSIQTTIG